MASFIRAFHPFWPALFSGALAIGACGDDGSGPMPDMSLADTADDQTDETADDIATDVAIQPRLDFAPCGEDTRLECADLQLPAEPVGAPPVSLRVTRAPALEPDHRLGVLFVNPGGPGAGGGGLVNDIANSGHGLHISRYFDVIAVDWRGTGNSTPKIDCFDAPTLEILHAAPRDDDEETLELMTSRFNTCLDGLGDAFVATLDATTAARDIERVRDILGEEKISFYGASYGTRLGAIYASLFPERVRAFVLDAAVAPEDDLIRLVTGQAEGMNLAFERFLSWCGEATNCSFNGGQGAEVVREAWTNLQAVADAEGIPGDDGRTHGAADLRAARRLLLAVGLHITLANALTEARDGDASWIGDIADIARGRGEDGAWKSTLSANMAIICADLMGEARPTREAWDAAIATSDDRFPEFHGAGGSYLPCFDRNLTTPVATIDAEDAPKLLVVAGEKDPSTPPQWSLEMHRALNNDSWYLSSTHEGHVAWGNAPRNVSHRIRDFLIDPSRFHDAWSCTSTLKPYQRAVLETIRVDSRPTLDPVDETLPVVIEAIDRKTGNVLGSATTTHSNSGRVELETNGLALDFFVRVRAEGYRSLEYHFLQPHIQSITVNATLLTPALFAERNNRPGIDATLSTMTMRAYDCDGAPVQGASFVLTPNAGRVVFRATDAGGGCVLNLNAPTTDRCGEAVAFGLAPGFYRATFSTADSPAIQTPFIDVRADTGVIVVMQP